MCFSDLTSITLKLRQIRAAAASMIARLMESDGAVDSQRCCWEQIEDNCPMALRANQFIISEIFVREYFPVTASISFLSKRTDLFLLISDLFFQF